jgi:hypothetical protein
MGLRPAHDADSRRGLTQPRGPASTRIAGSKVTAARKATPTPIADATPTVWNTPIRAKLISRKVMPTVVADAAITFPIEINARSTARSKVSPDRR